MNDLYIKAFPFDVSPGLCKDLQVFVHKFLFTDPWGMRDMQTLGDPTHP